jgi:hypothetical protein
MAAAPVARQQSRPPRRIRRVANKPRIDDLLTGRCTPDRTPSPRTTDSLMRIPARMYQSTTVDANRLATFISDREVAGVDTRQPHISPKICLCLHAYVDGFKRPRTASRGHRMAGLALPGRPVARPPPTSIGLPAVLVAVRRSTTALAPRSAVVESAEGDLAEQQADGRRDRDGDERADDAEQDAPHQDGDQADQRRHAHRTAHDPGHDEVVLG